MDLSPWVTSVTPSAGLIGIVSWVIYAILKGKLRPGSVVEELRQDRDARIADRDEQIDGQKELIAMWKEAYEGSEKARQIQEPLLREVVEQGRTTVQLLQALRTATGRDEIVG